MVFSRCLSHQYLALINMLVQNLKFRLIRTVFLFLSKGLLYLQKVFQINSNQYIDKEIMRHVLCDVQSIC